MEVSRQTSGKLKGSTARRTAKESLQPRIRAVGTKLVASFWAAAKTHKKCANGWTAAGVTGFIGFAVGRTVFWDPLIDWRSQRITGDAAIAEIGDRYRAFVDIFENARHWRKKSA